MESLAIGTRVCAYWSQKYHHLYPGTISDMDIDPKLGADYVNIELDDGDNRDIHVDSIRFLPTDFPLVGEYFYISNKRRATFILFEKIFQALRSYFVYLFLKNIIDKLDENRKIGYF